MSSTDPLREAAVQAAERGWPVLLLCPNSKVPALHSIERCPGTGACPKKGRVGWEQRATSDPTVIEGYWGHHVYDIGLAAGPAGLVVLDLDVVKPGEEAPEGWNVLDVSSGSGFPAWFPYQAERPLPVEYTVDISRDGRHLYCREAGRARAVQNQRCARAWVAHRHPRLWWLRRHRRSRSDTDKRPPA